MKELKCQNCGKIYVSGKNNKYCSEGCEQKAKNEARQKGVHWEWSEGNEPKTKQAG